MLFANAAIEKHIKTIESEIGKKRLIIKHLERRLVRAEQTQMNEEHAKAERKYIPSQLEASEAIGALETLLANVSRDWTQRENRFLGHVVLSPPIGFNVGEEGFMEDWAVVEIDDAKVDSTNFVGNVIDPGTTVPMNEFIDRMYQHPSNPHSFNYPGNRLLKFYNTIPDEETWKPSEGVVDHNNDPCIMVMKRGYASDLTIGCLNSIRSFTRFYFKGQPGQMSKAVAILPRNSNSGAFSKPGDSGSAVVDGKGRLAGLLTGGSGACSYVTSINVGAWPQG